MLKATTETRWVHVPEAGVCYRATVLRRVAKRVTVPWGPDAATHLRGRRQSVPARLVLDDAELVREWVPLAEAADALGVTPESVRRYVLAGRLPGRKLGPGRSPWLVDRASLMAFAEVA